MKNITISIEDEVKLLCSDLIDQKKLSPTINSLLKSFLQFDNNNFLKEKESLIKERDSLEKKLKDVSAKLMIIATKEKKAQAEAKQKTLNTLKGLRSNNPLRNVF
jgi:NADH/NAD ratio-sensing transcriptional regulator Rex